MARGRRTSLPIRLTADERQTLLAWQRSRSISAGLARRARIIVLLAQGVSITDITAKVGITRRLVYKWAQRFVQEGVAGLYDKPTGVHRVRPLQPLWTERHNVPT